MKLPIFLLLLVFSLSLGFSQIGYDIEPNEDEQNGFGLSLVDYPAQSSTASSSTPSNITNLSTYFMFRNGSNAETVVNFNDSHTYTDNLSILGLLKIFSPSGFTSQYTNPELNFTFYNMDSTGVLNTYIPSIMNDKVTATHAIHYAPWAIFADPDAAVDARINIYGKGNSFLSPSKLMYLEYSTVNNESRIIHVGNGNVLIDSNSGSTNITLDAANVNTTGKAISTDLEIDFPDTNVDFSEESYVGGFVKVPMLEFTNNQGTGLGAIANGLFIIDKIGTDPSITLYNDSITDFVKIRYDIDEDDLDFEGGTSYNFDNNLLVKENLTAGNGTEYWKFYDGGTYPYIKPTSGVGTYGLMLGGFYLAADSGDNQTSTYLGILSSDQTEGLYFEYNNLTNDTNIFTYSDSTPQIKVYDGNGNNIFLNLTGDLNASGTICDSNGCIGSGGGGGGNPFDQSLNTTDNVTHRNLTLTDTLTINTDAARKSIDILWDGNRTANAINTNGDFEAGGFAAAVLAFNPTIRKWSGPFPLITINSALVDSANYNNGTNRLGGTRFLVTPKVDTSTDIVPSSNQKMYDIQTAGLGVHFVSNVNNNASYEYKYYRGGDSLTTPFFSHSGTGDVTTDVFYSDDISTYKANDGTANAIRTLGGDWRMQANSDKSKLYLGQGDNASISYNGTNLLVNPNELGNGDVIFEGNMTAENITLDHLKPRSIFINNTNETTSVFKIGGNGDNIIESHSSDSYVDFDLTFLRLLGAKNHTNGFEFSSYYADFNNITTILGNTQKKNFIFKQTDGSTYNGTGSVSTSHEIVNVEAELVPSADVRIGVNGLYDYYNSRYTLRPYFRQLGGNVNNTYNFIGTNYEMEGFAPPTITSGNATANIYGIQFEGINMPCSSPSLECNFAAIYDNSGKDWILDSDNQNITLGEGADATLRYNGTDIILNPKNNGSGSVYIDGDLYADNITADYFIGDGSQLTGVTADVEHYAYFDSGSDSLTSDAFFIGQGMADSDATHNTIYLPDINITEFSCYIQDNSGSDQSQFTIYDGGTATSYNHHCTTVAGGQTCINSTEINFPAGTLTIDYEELAGTTSGHGTCWVKYKVI